ncbi:MAG: hypothetical protein E7513_03035 [Ruminococcaceae bacterium]|nr:hypothetical protein [Oscillospiraceae bacterium]
MDDIFEKKIKEFLPYIIIIGVLYLFFPAILVFTKSSGVFNQIVYMGLFPLAALGSCFHYAYKKKSDFFLSLVAPIFFIPSMLLYGNIRDSVLNSIIFLVSYFICGYLGLTLGEMLSGRVPEKEEKPQKSHKSVSGHMRKRVPKSVKPSAHKHESSTDFSFDEIEMPQKFEDVLTEMDTTDASDVFESTADDIDSILEEIHNRQV